MPAGVVNAGRNTRANLSGDSANHPRGFCRREPRNSLFRAQDFAVESGGIRTVKRCRFALRSWRQQELQWDVQPLGPCHLAVVAAGKAERQHARKLVALGMHPPIDLRLQRRIPGVERGVAVVEVDAMAARRREAGIQVVKVPN